MVSPTIRGYVFRPAKIFPLKALTQALIRYLPARQRRWETSAVSHLKTHLVVLQHMLAHIRNRNQSPIFTALLASRRPQHGEHIYAPVSRPAMAPGISPPLETQRTWAITNCRTLKLSAVWPTKPHKSFPEMQGFPIPSGFRDVVFEYPALIDKAYSLLTATFFWKLSFC